MKRLSILLFCFTLLFALTFRTPIFSSEKAYTHFIEDTKTSRISDKLEEVSFSTNQNFPISKTRLSQKLWSPLAGAVLRFKLLKLIPFFDLIKLILKWFFNKLIWQSIINPFISIPLVLFFWIGNWLTSLVEKEITSCSIKLRTEVKPMKNFLKKTVKKTFSSYSGEILIPQKIYKDDSCNVSINLKKSLEPGEEENTSQQSEESVIDFGEIQLATELEYFLEAEIGASGFKVEGDKKQRDRLAVDEKNLLYQWNCHFSTSGNHEFNLLLRIADSSQVVIAKSKAFHVKVIQAFGLTQAQISVFQSLSAIATLIIAIVALIKSFIPTHP